MLKSAIMRLIDARPLAVDDSEAIIHALLHSDNELQIAATLALCNARSETDLTELLFNLVTQLRRHQPTLPTTPDALDIVGTGGDHTNTLNLSTATALLLASAGIPIAKHGNRSVSSRCGSADVLEALGIDIQQPMANSPYFSFYFAPAVNPLLKKYALLRKKFALPTLFNYCGPLLNPAQPTRALIGVHDPKMLPIYARLCPRLGFRHVLLVHTSGMDELACLAHPQVVEVRNQQTNAYQLDMAELGLPLCSFDDLNGTDADSNAKTLLAIFSGQAHPARDTLLLNVAGGCYLYGLAPSIKLALPIARTIMANQSVLSLIAQLRESPRASTPN